MATLPPPSLPPMRPPPAYAGSDPPAPPYPGLETPPPPAAEAEVTVSRLSASVSPDAAVEEQLEELERWVVANQRADFNDRVRFWALRGVGFVGSAGAALSGGLQGAQSALAFGGAAAIAIAIEAAWTGSTSKSPFQRAVHEIRELENTIKLRWDKVRLAHADPAAPQRTAHALALLDAVQARREDIGKQLRNAEPSPGVAATTAKRF